MQTVKTDQTGRMPSLRWAHTHFVGFVMRRLIYTSTGNGYNGVFPIRRDKQYNDSSRHTSLIFMTFWKFSELLDPFVLTVRIKFIPSVI